MSTLARVFLPWPNECSKWSPFCFRTMYPSFSYLHRAHPLAAISSMFWWVTASSVITAVLKVIVPGVRLPDVAVAVGPAFPCSLGHGPWLASGQLFSQGLAAARLRLQDEVPAHMIEQFEQQIARLKDVIRTLIANNPEFARRARIQQSIKGFGAVTAAVLCAEIPELGTIDRHASAALAGLAPYPDDSGKRTGQRYIKGGRMLPRNTLFMAATSAIKFNPDMKSFYDQLIGRGKAHKVALTAVMRKLVILANVLVHDDQEGSPTAPEVESGAGAPALGSGGFSVAFAPGLSPAPMAAFPVPRSPNPACGFPAPGSPVGSCTSHTDHQNGSWEGGTGWSGNPRPMHASHPASRVVSGVPPGLFTPRRRRTFRVRPLRFRM